MAKIFWLLPILGAMAGGAVALLTMLFADSAPKEAAGYAMACAFAVVPYVFARSIDAMIDHKWHEDLRSMAHSLDAMRADKR